MRPQRDHYPFKLKSVQPAGKRKGEIPDITYTYIFHDDNKHKYHVKVHQYCLNKKNDENLFLIKFFRNSDKGSSNPYDKTYKNDSITTVKRVICTVFEILLEVVKGHKASVFGFHGAWDKKDLNEKRKSDVTRRFNIWRSWSSLYFPPENFEYAIIEGLSTTFFTQKSNCSSQWAHRSVEHLKRVHGDIEEMLQIPKKFRKESQELILITPIE